jgi:hypothetical protein
MKVKYLIYIIALCFIVKYNIVYMPVFWKEAISNNQNLTNEGVKGMIMGIVDIIIICAFIIHGDFTDFSAYWNKIMNKEI